MVKVRAKQSERPETNKACLRSDRKKEDSAINTDSKEKKGEREKQPG